MDPETKMALISRISTVLKYLDLGFKEDGEKELKQLQLEIEKGEIVPF